MKSSEIKLNKNNPRIIKNAKFKALVKSLKDFPEMSKARPIVINQDNMILGGNMRYKAMIEAGWTDIPIKKVNWSEKKQKEFIVKDNLAYGEWDYDILANDYDLKELEEYGMEMDSFNLENEIIEDEAPAVEQGEPISKLGEVYQLGRHRLMCGDSTKIEDVEKLMGGKKADMVFTDPPYGMFLDTDFSDMEGIAKGNKYDNVIGDHNDFTPELITTVFEKFGYCKEIFMWGGDYYSELLENRNKGSWVVWDKMRGGEGVNDNYDKMFGSNFEMCWSKERHKRAIARVLWKGIFGLSSEDTKSRVHPTQKPTELVRWFTDKFSKPKGLIIDLFGGSGSTLIACEQTDRTCYMMELDKKYADVIRKRYYKFVTGNEEGWEKGTPAISG